MSDSIIREIRRIRANPRFRHYPEYKESGVEWVGEIPKHWKIVRGKFILTNKKEINSDFQCDNLLSLTLNGVLRKDMDSTEGLRPDNYRTYQVFYPDDLVFKLIDLENIQTSRVGIVPEKGIMSPVYIRLESESDLYERYYFYQYYDLYKKHIFNFLGKGVRSSLSPSDLLEIPLAFPPLSEQTQIANFLDRKTEQIDELIRIKERRIELLQEQRTALINQAVTKGLDPTVEMKPSGVEWIGEIPAHWEVKKIKYVATFISEKSMPETDAIRISPENVESKTGKVLNFFSSYDSNGVKFQVGDVLFNKIRVYLNKVVYAEYDGYSLGEMIIIRPSLQDIGKYLFYLMLSSRFIEYCDSISRGAKMPRTDVYDILNAQVPITSHQEQTQIVDFLDRKTQQVNELIATEHRKIQLLQEYRQSLISEAVTGKIDVRNEV